MSSDKGPSGTALQVALEFKALCFERKLMTFAKSHGVNLAVEGFLPALCSSSDLQAWKKNQYKSGPVWLGRR
jgi:hypothetical protein